MSMIISICDCINTVDSYFVIDSYLIITFCSLCRMHLSSLKRMAWEDSENSSAVDSSDWCRGNPNRLPSFHPNWSPSWKQSTCIKQIKLVYGRLGARDRSRMYRNTHHLQPQNIRQPFFPVGERVENYQIAVKRSIIQPIPKTRPSRAYFLYKLKLYF